VQVGNNSFFSAVTGSNSASEKLILYVAADRIQYAPVVATSDIPNQEVGFNKKTVFGASRKRKIHKPMQRKQYIMSMGSTLLSTPS
jgi:hypothetical protein